MPQIRAKMPDGSTHLFASMEEAQAAANAMRRGERPALPAPPPGKNLLERLWEPVAGGLQKVARGVRSLPNVSPNPILGGAEWLGREMIAGTLEDLSQPVKNLPTIAATIATLPFGGSGGTAMRLAKAARDAVAAAREVDARGGTAMRLAKAAGGAALGTAGREGYRAATGQPVDAMAFGTEPLFHAAVESLGGIPRAAQRGAVNLQARALRPLVDFNDIVARRSEQDELFRVLTGRGGKKVPLDALRDLAAQTLEPGMGRLGSKQAAEQVSSRVSALRKAKEAAMARVAGEQIVPKQAQRGLSRVAESLESSARQKPDIEELKKTTSEFFDRKVMVRDEFGNPVLGPRGVPEFAEISGFNYTVPQVDGMIQDLGKRLSKAKAFGTESGITQEAWKSIRQDLKDALASLAPEIPALNLKMSRLMPAEMAYATAADPAGVAVGLGELGFAGGNLASAAVATSRRPQVLSALARVIHVGSKIPATLRPEWLSNLMRVGYSVTMQPMASHESTLPPPPPVR